MTRIPRPVRFWMLERLRRNSGQAVSRLALFTYARLCRYLGPLPFDPEIERSVDAQIHKLRRDGHEIETVRGFGYRLVREAPREAAR